MKLSINTFGKTPACMYVAHLLNDLDDPILARKVGKLLHNIRQTLNDVVACHYNTDEMKTTSFSALIHLIEADARARCLNLSDPFIGHLCANIIVGEIRTYKRRSATARVRQSNIARKTPSGESVPYVKALPTPTEETEEARIQRLKDRSSAYLARHNKRNTLYN